MFEEFWVSYPKKVGKADARKAFSKLTEEQKSAAISAIETHKQFWKIKQTEIDYIPYPATWLRGERWEDELDLQPKQIKKPELPWYSTDELTLKKGEELGLRPQIGETFGQFRQRISGAMHRQATNNLA